MPRAKEHDVCTFEGCGRPHKAHGLCASHYQQFKRDEPLRSLQVRAYDYGPTCTVEGCESPVQSKGLCNTHYRQWYRTGSTQTTRVAKSRSEA